MIWRLLLLQVLQVLRFIFLLEKGYEQGLMSIFKSFGSEQMDLRALRVENGMLSIQVKDIKSLNKRWRGRWWGSSRRPSGTFRMSLARLPCIQQDFGQSLFNWSAMIFWSGGQALHILYTVLIIKQFLMLMLHWGTPWAWSPGARPLPLKSARVISVPLKLIFGS